MPRSSSRSASKPAENKSVAVEKRATRDSTRSPASAAGKRTPVAKKSPAAAATTPKSAERPARSRSAAKTPAKTPRKTPIKKSSPSPRSTSRGKARSSVRGRKGKKHEEEEEDDEEEEEEEGPTVSKAKRAKVVVKKTTPVAQKRKSTGKAGKDSGSKIKTGRSSSSPRVSSTARKRAAPSPRTPSQPVRSRRAASASASPSARAGRGRKAAKRDVDDAEIMSPKGKRAKFSEKKDQKSKSTTEEGDVTATPMETEETQKDSGDGLTTATNDEKKEESSDFAVGCGFEVVDSKDLPAGDSAEVLEVISSLKAHAGVTETDDAGTSTAVESVSSAVPMETSDETCAATTTVSAAVDIRDVTLVEGKPLVKSPVNASAVEVVSVNVKTQIKSPEEVNSAEVKTKVTTPIKVSDLTDGCAEVKTSMKSPAKVNVPADACPDVKTPVKSPGKISNDAEVTTTGKSPMKVHSAVEIVASVSESPSKVSESDIADGNNKHAESKTAQDSSAEVSLTNGNSNGQIGSSNGGYKDGDAGVTSGIDTDISVPSDLSTNDQHGTVDKLFSREWLNNSKIVTPASATNRSFTLVSYNILADQHADKDFASAPWMTPGLEEWKMTHRHKRFMAELAYLDADVICLQEVGTDYFNTQLLPALQDLGYDGVYFPRRNDYKEGGATFYRLKHFTLDTRIDLALGDAIQQEIDSSTLEIKIKASTKAVVDTQTVALVTRLKVVGDNEYVSIANIHSAWDKFKRQDKQCLQIAHTMRALQKLTKSEEPHIICGDFNSWKDSVPYQLMQDGHLNEASLIALQAIEEVKEADGQMAPVIKHWPQGFEYSPVSNMKSSYLTVTGSEPLTSRFPMDGVLRGVDFIWFSANLLDVAGVLKTVDAELMKNGAPSALLPSDHLSLKAQFIIK